MARDGQVFFIHNRVETISDVMRHIEKLVPNANIKAVHGQMPADTIDSIFHQFKQGDIDVLVATTIVENGIDISNANTILIDQSHRFGLSELYQLRGRVGRWKKICLLLLSCTSQSRAQGTFPKKAKCPY